jgi:hypothetical protein
MRYTLWLDDAAPVATGAPAAADPTGADDAGVDAGVGAGMG